MGTENEASAPSSNEHEITHDSSYYRESTGGDLVILLVENILLKIHRYLLTREESTFSDMLGLPRESVQITEGESDDAPIKITDTSIEEFRALCWALYAPLAEIRQQEFAQANIPRLFALALISNKFNISSLEEWSTDVLLHHCGGPLDYCSTCSHEHLEQLLTVAVRCNRSDLEKAVGTRWVERVKSRHVPVSHALDVLDRFYLRLFMGRIYYSEALYMASAEPLTEETTAVRIPTHNLYPTHISRLLSGFYSLPLIWDRICTKRMCMCSGKRCDLGSWVKLLGTISTRFKSVDVLGKLEYAIENHSNIGWDMYYGRDSISACQNRHKEYLEAQLFVLKERLADHFFGPEDTLLELRPAE